MPDGGPVPLNDENAISETQCIQVKTAGIRITPVEENLARCAAV
jgi:hypothetical protein